MYVRGQCSIDWIFSADTNLVSLSCYRGEISIGDGMGGVLMTGPKVTFSVTCNTCEHLVTEQLEYPGTVRTGHRCGHPGHLVPIARFLNNPETPRTCPFYRKEVLDSICTILKMVRE